MKFNFNKTAIKGLFSIFLLVALLCVTSIHNSTFAAFDEGENSSNRNCETPPFYDTWWNQHCSMCRNNAITYCTVMGGGGLSADALCRKLLAPGCGCTAISQSGDCPGNPTEAQCQAEGKKLVDKGLINFDCGLNDRYDNANSSACTNAGTCVKKECGDATCSKNEDCPTGQVCLNNKCQLPDTCKTDADCRKTDPKKICENEKCIPGCRANGDCDAGFICKDKKCVAGCVTNSDCDRTKCETCQSGVCKVNAADPRCSSSTPPPGCVPTELNCGYIDCKNCIESSGYDRSKAGESGYRASDCRGGSEGTSPQVDKTKGCGEQYVSKDYCSIYVPQVPKGRSGGNPKWGLDNKWQYYSKDKACWENNSSTHYYAHYSGSTGSFQTESAICTAESGNCPADPKGDPWYKTHTVVNAKYQHINLTDRPTFYIRTGGYERPNRYCRSYNCGGGVAYNTGAQCQIGPNGINGERCEATERVNGSPNYWNTTCSWKEYCHDNRVIGSISTPRGTCDYHYRDCDTCGTAPNEYSCNCTCEDSSAPYEYVCEPVVDRKNEFSDSCGTTSQCERRLQGQYDLDNSSTWESRNPGQSCEQPERFQVIFNENAACATSYSPNPGQKIHDQFSPCECKASEYTVDYKLIGTNPNGSRFSNVDGQCILKWSRQLDGDTDVNGRGNLWGEAGSNGHYILEPVPGANGKDINGWEWDSRNCRFVCEGSDTGADCYGANDVAKATIKFVPDLRLVTYNDPSFGAQWANVKTGSGNNCTSVSYNNEKPIDTSFPYGGIGERNVSQWARYFYSESQATYRYDFNPYLDLARTSFNTSPGYWSEMVNGSKFSRGSAQEIRLSLFNNYDKTSDPGYWTCVCPTTTIGDNRTNDCRLQYTPNNDKSICTTKRIYIGYRACYTTPWWQVSGGNVYAYSNIVDAVPNNLSDDPTCGGSISTGESLCVDTTAPGGDQANDMKLTEPTSSRVAGNKSCTPRIIRGRTPCKNDGPSNSAGIALTQAGYVIAADTSNYFYNRGNKVASNKATIQTELRQRVSERSKIHALYAGNSYGTNSLNKNGQQARVANSRAVPYLNPGGLPYQQNGHQPPREDYRYFMNLAGGEAMFNNTGRIISTKGGNPNVQLNNIINSGHSCAGSVVEGEYVYICLIDGDLRIDTQANPWHLEAVNKNPLVPRSLTVFVTGNVTITGPADQYNTNSNAAITVANGNFLSIIAAGNMVIDPQVGIAMPDPRTASNLDRCWEGQSAKINGNHAGSTEAYADSVNLIGVMEGVFVIDGNITTETYKSSATCMVDKRFIGHGSFISWGTIRLLRDFSTRGAGCEMDAYGFYNNRIPAETFIYRPDLVRNTPAWMKRSFVSYQEVTGGLTQ